MVPDSQNGDFVGFGFCVERENESILFVDTDRPFFAPHLFVMKTLPISQRSFVWRLPDYVQLVPE
jgi:hypothetical protein